MEGWFRQIGYSPNVTSITPQRPRAGWVYKEDEKIRLQEGINELAHVSMAGTGDSYSTKDLRSGYVIHGCSFPAAQVGL